MQAYLDVAKEIVQTKNLIFQINISPLIKATALLQSSPWSAIPFVLMNGCQEFRSFIYQFHTLFQDSDSFLLAISARLPLS